MDRLSDAERYQREFDDLMHRTQLQAARAAHLQGVDNLEQLFEAAKRAGLDQVAAWRIVERNQPDAKSGVLALIEAVRERSNA
jgi:hypothetical protein